MKQMMELPGALLFGIKHGSSTNKLQVFKRWRRKPMIKDNKFKLPQEHRLRLVTLPPLQKNISRRITAIPKNDLICTLNQLFIYRS